MNRRNTLTFLVSTTIAGLLLLVPLVLLGVLAFFAYDFLVELARNSGIDLPFGEFVDGLIIGLGALLAVVLLCFGVGLVLRTSLGSTLESRYDGLLEKYVPVAAMLRNLVMQIVGSREEVLKLKPAEVSLYGSSARQYALIVEELPGGRVVVFVPSVPAATLGQLYVLPIAEVTLLDTPVQELLNAVTQWGAGSSLMYPGETASKKDAS